MLEALIHQLPTEAKWMTLAALRVRFLRYIVEDKIDTFKNMEKKLLKMQ